MKVFLTAQAHRDIAAIKSYISENSPQAAARIAGRLYDEANDLAKSPRKGVALSAKFGIKTDLRMWIISSNLMLYKITADTIIVMRIINERRDYLSAMGLAESKQDNNDCD